MSAMRTLWGYGFVAKHVFDDHAFLRFSKTMP